MVNYFLFFFCLAVFVVFYSYVLFPLILSFLANGKTFRHAINEKSSDLPAVSIVISAFNEERVIGEKLKSILKSVYPKDKMEILVGSDASNDATEKIVRSIAATDSRIRFIQFGERRGKPSVINDLVSGAKNPILILTDANVMFEPDTIAYLNRHFISAEIGLVGANILNIGMKKDGISMQEKSYIERENRIKYQEGLIWGSMMGPFGGCYALRKDLFAPVPSNFLVDDFFISMKVLEKGYKCINELEAICYEDVSNEVKQEYKRKARVSTGNFQNLKVFSGFLLKPFSPAGYCFISHKVLRWLTPFLILVSLLSLVAMLMLTGHPLFKILLGGELLLLFTPVIDSLMGKAGIHLRLLRFVSYFSLMNLALLHGFFRFLFGVRNNIWTPTKRNI